MTREVDLAIIGLGGLGSAAACWAARRPGLRVLGLEQFELGHANGASEDVSRIIRRSYHRADYVRLTGRAYACWREVERETRTVIVHRNGGLDVGPREPSPGSDLDLETYARAMDAESIPYERLDGPEIVRRWPAWSLDDRHAGLFQADAGIADPSAGNAAHRRLAQEAGAELRERTRVVDLRDDGGGVTLTLEQGERITAGRVIVAADAWTNDVLAGLGVRLPLTVTQEQVAWWTPTGDPARFSPDRFPVWIWMDTPSFYGFPSHGHPGPKIGQDVGGREVTAATRTFEPDPAVIERARRFLAAHLPAMGAGTPFLAKTCLYTMPPDRDFIVDALPGHPAVVVLQGAAHAYKFASVLGRVGVELALDGTTPSAPELGAFRIDRPALQRPPAAPRVTI